MYSAGWEFITLHSSVHYGGKWGPLSLLFNGPTSRNVAGYLFGCLMCAVIFYFWVLHCLLCLRSWACRTVWRGHNIWFRSPGRVSFPPAPPRDFALSEPLPGGLQGWLQLVSDIETRSCLQRRKVRRRAATWMLRGREAQGGRRRVKKKKKTKPEVLCRDGMSKHLCGASLQMAPQMFSRFMATLSIVLVRDWKAKVEERETTKTGELDKRWRHGGTDGNSFNRLLRW